MDVKTSAEIDEHTENAEAFQLYTRGKYIMDDSFTNWHEDFNA